MKYLARKVNPKLYPIDDPEKQYLMDEMLDLNQDWRVARRNAETYVLSGAGLGGILWRLT